MGGGAGATIVTGTEPGVMASTSTPAGSPTMVGVNECAPGARPAASSTGVTSACAQPAERRSGAAEGERQLIESRKARILAGSLAHHADDEGAARDRRNDGRNDGDGRDLAVREANAVGQLELDLEGLIRRCAVEADRGGLHGLDLGEVLRQAHDRDG